jgi:hypothetical protein
MPTVNGKSYSYDKKGMAAARTAMQKDKASTGGGKPGYIYKDGKYIEAGTSLNKKPNPEKNRAKGFSKKDALKEKLTYMVNSSRSSLNSMGKKKK